MTIKLIGTQSAEVREHDSDVDTGLLVKSGDTLIIHASGSIHSGVFLTGPNGPDGWDWVVLDNKFPLPSSHPYSLIGRIGGDDQPWIYIGSRQTIVCSIPEGNLHLRTNDDRPGNGDGAFHVDIAVYRDV